MVPLLRAQVSECDPVRDDSACIGRVDGRRSVAVRDDEPKCDSRPENHGDRGEDDDDLDRLARSSKYQGAHGKPYQATYKDPAVGGSSIPLPRTGPYVHDSAGDDQASEREPNNAKCFARPQYENRSDNECHRGRYEKLELAVPDQRDHQFKEAQSHENKADQLLGIGDGDRPGCHQRNEGDSTDRVDDDLREAPRGRLCGVWILCVG